MRFQWPEDTEFHRLVLDVEQDGCDHCGCPLHICDHRIRHIYTLEHPLELCCRLAHCSDPACPSRPHTLSPAAELSVALPGWLIGWDVFSWIGHRRFARHWSIPQIRHELADSRDIKLSPDGIAVYIHRYQNMLAARQQDFARLQRAYQDIDKVDLSIDGLQPEKGHETLYAVRELRGKRIWFAEALISSTEAEVRRLLVRAGAMAKELGKPIRLWMSDKQDAFVKGIAAEFDGIPHLYCGNHFLRGLAKPTLAADSTAKVKMRKKVRGLRAIEREVLEQRRDCVAAEQPEQATQDKLEKEDAPAASASCTATANGRLSGDGDSLRGDSTVAEQEVATTLPCAAAAEQSSSGADAAGEIVLDDCAAVGGILLSGSSAVAEQEVATTLPCATAEQSSSGADAAADIVLDDCAAVGGIPLSGSSAVAEQEVATTLPCAAAEQSSSGADAAGEIVLDDCAAVGGIPLSGSSAVAEQEVATTLPRAVAEQSSSSADAAADIVLDYCAAVRGILNDDQGGPLNPPGLRMAEALTEVRESLQRNLDLHKEGSAHEQLEQLAKCIDKGLEEVKAEQQEVKEQVKEIQRVAETLDATTGTVEERKEKYEELQAEYEQKEGEFYDGMATMMAAWMAGLFLPVELQPGEQAPVDNLDLERWFRLPKGHERRIHGHKHAGVRIVQEGPTLVLTLDAHQEHDGLFTAEDLLPYRHAQPPKDQLEAMQRRKVMRKARSKKNEKTY